jgi:glucuronate isomerase
VTRPRLRSAPAAAPSANEAATRPRPSLPRRPATREIARGLYEGVAQLPILSPHGHVDPRLRLENTPFGNSAELFIRYDCYVTRLMHAAGVQLTELGIPDCTGDAPTAKLCEV